MKAVILFISVVFLLINLDTQTKSEKELIYKTKSGHVIRVNCKRILYDGKLVFTFKFPDEVEIDYKKDYLIEDNGSAFLFLFSYGNPNLDRFNVYQILATGTKLVADSIASQIKDYDNDGKLEFGGRDLTEMHPSPDSMYYIPTKYFEISNGKISIDKALTKQMDIKINGIYLSKPLDKDGNCCTAIPITKEMREIERKHRG
ncbi:MAG: hypothetical protein ACXVAY_14370 [Mucilaginibacter sp.]